MSRLPEPAPAEIELTAVLQALANPTRLTIVRRLASGEAMTCSTVLPEVTKSTASRHWKVLRESGVLHATKQGREIIHALRSDDLNTRFPGLLDAVLAADAEQH